MISISKLVLADLGRKVVYEQGHTKEEGFITGYNDLYVFVRFRGPNGEACDPKNLTFINNSAIPPSPPTQQ